MLNKCCITSECCITGLSNWLLLFTYFLISWASGLIDGQFQLREVRSMNLYDQLRAGARAIDWGMDRLSE